MCTDMYGSSDSTKNHVAALTGMAPFMHLSIYSDYILYLACILLSGSCKSHKKIALDAELNTLFPVPKC